jgi:hypothetical protein
MSLSFPRAMKERIALCVNQPLKQCKPRKGHTGVQCKYAISILRRKPPPTSCVLYGISSIMCPIYREKLETAETTEEERIESTFNMLKARF